jgi:hypothetical protein
MGANLFIIFFIQSLWELTSSSFFYTTSMGANLFRVDGGEGLQPFPLHQADETELVASPLQHMEYLFKIVHFQKVIEYIL